MTWFPQGIPSLFFPSSKMEDIDFSSSYISKNETWGANWIKGDDESFKVRCDLDIMWSRHNVTANLDSSYHIMWNQNSIPSIFASLWIMKDDDFWGLRWCIPKKMAGKRGQKDESYHPWHWIQMCCTIKSSWIFFIGVDILMQSVLKFCGPSFDDTGLEMAVEILEQTV